MSLIRRNPDLAAAMLLALVTACFSDISFSSLHESIEIFRSSRSLFLS